MDYSDWASLVAAAVRGAHNILKTDVAPVAIQIMREHIQSDIYEVYTPRPGAWVGGSTYTRRHVLEDATYSETIGRDTLFVTSKASASPSILQGRKGRGFQDRYPGAFLKMIESGNTGIWKNGFARPVVKNTRNEFKSGSRIRDAIIKGISREITGG